jgi:hypothetical protein
MRAIIVFVAALLPFMLSACESTEDRMPEVVVHTPLDVDPLDEIELGRWWSDGEVMLRLDPDGSYALYGSTNRYHDPIQRGRWSKPSYAYLILEPYARFEHAAVRVEVARVGDVIALEHPRFGALVELEGPPRVAEDGLLGRWLGPPGVLELFEDGRYAIAPAPADDAGRVIIAGHRGRWRLDAHRLTLTPNPTGMQPIELRVETRGDETVLIGADVEFTRPTAPADEDSGS